MWKILNDEIDIIYVIDLAQSIDEPKDKRNILSLGNQTILLQFFFFSDKINSTELRKKKAETFLQIT